MRAARSVAHEKADYYAAILDELKERSSSLSPSAHQRLLLGLLGDPTRAKVAKESSALLKAIQREEPSQFSRSSSRQLRRQVGVSLLQIIREGVKVYDFFRHFKGNFKGRHYDSAVPPVSVFPNSPCCRRFCDFIDSTVLDWVSQGVIKVHGVVGFAPLRT